MRCPHCNKECNNGLAICQHCGANRIRSSKSTTKEKGKAMSNKTIIQREVVDPTKGMASIHENVRAASTNSAKRSHERLSGESLSAPFNEAQGDLRADGKLFKQLTAMALENATKIFADPITRPLREHVDRFQLEGTTAPPSLTETLSNMGQQSSVDVRVFPESGGVCVVGMWAPERNGNGTIYPYQIDEVVQEKRVYVFNDGGRIHKYEANTLKEAHILHDKNVPLDERFGEPSVSLTYIKEAANFDAPFEVVVQKEGKEQTSGQYDTPKRAFNKLVELYHNDLSGKIVGKSGNTWLSTKDKTKDLGGDSFEPVKNTGKLTREDFAQAQKTGQKMLISVDSKHDGALAGNLGFVKAEGLKVGSTVTVHVEDRQYFGSVLDMSEAIIFAEMSYGNKMAPDAKSKAVKLDPSSFTDHKDKPRIM